MVRAAFGIKVTIRNWLNLVKVELSGGFKVQDDQVVSSGDVKQLRNDVEFGKVVDQEGLVFYRVLVQYKSFRMMQCDNYVSFMVIDLANGIPPR